ncbi:MAG: hemerythrin domain-containing protein [Thioalkalivibrio sp.]
MNQFLKPPAPGFDDPLALLRACHSRIQERLDTLERLPGHLSRVGADPEARHAAERILDYFDRAAPHHHADEDSDLFPLLLAGHGRPGWDNRLPRWLERLAGEHPKLEAGWARLRPALQAVAEGDSGARPRATEWIAATRDHLALEEENVLPLALRLLSPEELHQLGAAMAKRRKVQFPCG